MNDRIELLREMLLQPLQGAMTVPADGALAMLEGNESAHATHVRNMVVADPAAFRAGAWHGYKLAVAIFERWMSMTGKCTAGGRFAVHSNPERGLGDGPIRVSSIVDGQWVAEKEDGGSCNG